MLEERLSCILGVELLLEGKWLHCLWRPAVCQNGSSGEEELKGQAEVGQTKYKINLFHLGLENHSRSA